MSSNVTARDRVWAAIEQQSGKFQLRDVKTEIDFDERPSDETIRRVLRAGEELDVIKHFSNSPNYEKKDNGGRF